MREPALDSIIISNDNKCKQTVTSFYRHVIFASIGFIVHPLSDFANIAVCRPVFFIALFVGCLSFAECKTQALNDMAIDSTNDRAVSYNGPNPSTMNTTGLNSRTMMNPEHQSSRLDMVRRQKSNSMAQHTVSNDGKNSSTLNSADLTSVTLANTEQQLSGLNSPQTQWSQSPRLDMVRHESNSTAQHTVSFDGMNSSMHNGADLTGVTFANMDQQLSGLNSPQKQWSQSSRLDMLRHKSNSTVNHTVRYDGSTTLNNLDSTSTTRGEPEQKLPGKNFAQRQESQSIGVNTPQNLGTRMLPLSSQNQSDGDSKNYVESLQRGEGILRRLISEESKNTDISGTKTTRQDSQQRQNIIRLIDVLQQVCSIERVQKTPGIPENEGCEPEPDCLRSNSQCGFKYLMKCIYEWKTDGDAESTLRKFQLLSLKAHNKYRAKHGVPPLTLNKELCETSQAYANSLAVIDPEKKMGHSEEARSGKYGENFTATRGYKVTARSVVDVWYAQISNYDFKTGSAIDERKGTGSFTQLIWKGSREMGFGYATSARGTLYVICHYRPRGNVKGEYLNNVPRKMTIYTEVLSKMSKKQKVQSQEIAKEKNVNQ